MKRIWVARVLALALLMTLLLPAAGVAAKKKKVPTYSMSMGVKETFQIDVTAFTAPEGKLLAQIEKTFGSVAALKEKLTVLALGQFGSGWAWLSANASGELMVSASPNQDNPIIEGTGFVPILAIDVWEHAYYLKYRNLRASYVAALFDVIDWKAVERNYERVAG